MVDPWQFVLDPEWLIGLVIVAVDYAVVVRHYGRRGQPVSTLRRLAFAAGLLVTALALFSPIENSARAVTSMPAANASRRSVETGCPRRP